MSTGVKVSSTLVAALNTGFNGKGGYNDSFVQAVKDLVPQLNDKDDSILLQAMQEKQPRPSQYRQGMDMESSQSLAPLAGPGLPPSSDKGRG